VSSFQRRFNARADAGVIGTSQLLEEIMTPRARGPRSTRRLALAGAAVLASTAVAAVALGGPARAATINSPVMTVAGGNSVIAVQTSGYGLRFYWNEHGTDTWHGEQVAVNNTTYSEPAIAQIGSDVVIAARGVGSVLDLYWQVNGGSGWTREIVAGYGTTYSAPSLAQDGSNVIISAQGPSDSLDFYWATGVTAAFSPEVVAGAGTTYSAPAETVNGNSVNIAADGPDQSLDFYWAVNGSPRWGPEVVAGAGTTGSAPAIVAQGGGVDIVALNQHGYGSVFYWAFNGTANWTPVTVPTGDTSASSIAAYPGGVHIVADEIFGYLYENSTVNGSGTFQYAEVDGPGGINGPGEQFGGVPAITMNGGLVNIADEDDAGNLRFYWQDSSGTFHPEVVDTAANL
jgi:hypothetical protein